MSVPFMPAARRGLVFGALGGLVAAGLEVAGTITLLAGADRRLLLLETVGVLTSLGAAIGAVTGVLWALLVRLAARLPRLGAHRWRGVLVAALASPTCVTIGWALFSGGHMRSLALRPVLIPAAAAALVLAVYLAVRRIEDLLSRAPAMSKLAFRGLVLLFVLAAAASYATDLTMFRRLYGYIHSVLSVATFASATAAVALVGARRAWVPGRGAAILTGLVALALAAASTATFDLSQNVRYTAFERTATLRNALLLVQAASGGESMTPRLSRAERRALYERERRAREAAGRTPTLPGANVILITADALRADQIGAWGGDARLSPNLDRLAASGVRFERAYCAAPHSSISLTSLFTSEYMREAIELGHDEPRQTIPDALNAAGYYTAAFYTRGIFHTEGERLRSYDDRRFGFSVTDHGNRVAEVITDRGIEEVDRLVARGEPKFFLWLHYFDTHEPYRSTELGDRPFDRYRAEIKHVDAQIGRFVRHARKTLGRDTVFVLTADHGEEFKEHGGHYHGSSTYDEQARVPLVFAAPRLRPGVVHGQVELVDVGPTLLRLVGVDPPPTMRGDDLRPFLFGGDGAMPQLPAFLSVTHKKTVVRWPWKLIADLQYDVYELYDLARDPREQTNLYDRERAVADELRAEIYGWLDGLGRPPALVAGMGAAEPPATSEAERAIALGRLQDKRAVRPLEELVCDQGQRVELRREAARLVGDLAEGSSREPLGRALDDPDEKLRVEAAAALARLRSARGRPILERAIYSEDPETRIVASLALGELGDRRAVDGLVEAMSWESLPVREQAIRLLGDLGDTRAIEPLLEILPEYRTRYLVVIALGKIGDDRAWDTLTELLDYEDHTDIRAYAVQALGSIPDPRSIDRLVRAFREEPEVKFTAESLIRLDAIGRGKVAGTDVGVGARALGSGWARCERATRERVGDFLNATFCTSAPGKTATLRIEGAADLGPSIVTWRARHDGATGRRATMTLRLGDHVLSPVRIGDAWEEYRARLDAPPHGDYGVAVEVRAEDGGGPIGAAVDHVLVVPAGPRLP
ncbi:MAG: HEAT repeat domain-containing protein [Deltaproteobacteria bacterium]|nr:HEAT repeat domain-containing protein [Deltaproteobacteria bacterium]